MSTSRQRQKTRSGKNEGEPQREQKQARSSTEPQSSPVVSLLLHLALLVFYVTVHVWGSIVLAELREKGLFFPNSETPAKMLKFATILNLYFQTAYCALALISDLMPIMKVKAKLKALCSYLFTTVAFPLSMVTVIGFWGLLMANRSYLHSGRTADLMEVFPPLLNHCWHTAVGIGVLLELFLVFHRYPSTPVALATIFTYHFGYTAEVFLLYYLADTLPYPFLRMMGPGGRAMFFLAVFPLVLALYFIGKALAHFRWRRKSIE